MKKLLFLFIPVLLVSCMGKIKVVKDDFKNAKVVTMQLREGSEESMLKGGGYAIFSYSRDIQNNKMSPVTIGLHITKAKLVYLAGNQDLEKKAVVKVNDKSYDVILGDTSAVNVTTISSQPNYATGGTQLSSSEHEEWSTKMILNKAIEDAIKTSKTVAVRLYFGTTPMTFMLGESSIKKVKEFMNAVE
ncbi:MAG TPA: hypothetical protein P5203_03440 [Spirochaetota bacterium]|nr:hypothetical protein [Spirochaetota bacterium]